MCEKIPFKVQNKDIVRKYWIIILLLNHETSTAKVATQILLRRVEAMGNVPKQSHVRLTTLMHVIDRYSEKST